VSATITVLEFEKETGVTSAAGCTEPQRAAQGRSGESSGAHESPSPFLAAPCVGPSAEQRHLLRDAVHTLVKGGFTSCLQGGTGAVAGFSGLRCWLKSRETSVLGRALARHH